MSVNLPNRLDTSSSGPNNKNYYGDKFVREKFKEPQRAGFREKDGIYTAIDAIVGNLEGIDDSSLRNVFKTDIKAALLEDIKENKASLSFNSQDDQGLVQEFNSLLGKKGVDEIRLVNVNGDLVFKFFDRGKEVKFGSAAFIVEKEKLSGFKSDSEKVEENGSVEKARGKVARIVRAENVKFTSDGKNQFLREIFSEYKEGDKLVVIRGNKQYELELNESKRFRYVGINEEYRPQVGDMIVHTPFEMLEGESRTEFVKVKKGQESKVYQEMKEKAKEGDRLVVVSGGKTNVAFYKVENDVAGFYQEGLDSAKEKEIVLKVGDKVRLVFQSVLVEQPKTFVEVSGKQYPIAKVIEDKAPNFEDIAKKVLDKDDNSIELEGGLKGAILNSKMEVSEYAKLLEEASRVYAKKDKVVIVIPPMKVSAENPVEEDERKITEERRIDVNESKNKIWRDALERAKAKLSERTNLRNVQLAREAYDRFKMAFDLATSEKDKKEIFEYFVHQIKGLNVSDDMNFKYSARIDSDNSILNKKTWEDLWNNGGIEGKEKLMTLINLPYDPFMKFKTKYGNDPGKIEAALGRVVRLALLKSRSSEGKLVSRIVFKVLLDDIGMEFPRVYDPVSSIIPYLNYNYAALLATIEREDNDGAAISVEVARAKDFVYAAEMFTQAVSELREVGDSYLREDGSRVGELPKGAVEVDLHRMEEGLEKNPEGSYQKLFLENSLRGLFSSNGPVYMDGRNERPMTMADVNAGKMGVDRKEVFYDRFNGDAARDYVMRKVRTVEGGVEKFKLENIKKVLDDLYDKGLKALVLDPRFNAEREKLFPGMDNEAILKQPKGFDIVQAYEVGKSTGKWGAQFPEQVQKVLQIGLLSEMDEKKMEQSETLNSQKEKVAKEISRGIYGDERIREELAKEGVNSEEELSKMMVNEVPVSMLFMLGYDTGSKKFTGTFGVPISLKIGKGLSLGIVPHFNTEGNLGIGVGVYKVNESGRWTFTYGIGFGVNKGGDSAGKFNLILGASGEVKYLVKPSSNESEWKTSLFGGATMGVDLRDFKFGLGPNAGFEWERDLKQQFKNGLDEGFRREGLKLHVDNLEKYAQSGDARDLKVLMDRVRGDGALLARLGVDARAADEMILYKLRVLVLTMIKDYEEKFAKEMPNLLKARVGVVNVTAVAGGVMVIMGGASIFLPLGAITLGVMSMFGINVGTEKFNSLSKSFDDNERQLMEEKNVENSQAVAFMDAANKSLGYKVEVSGENVYGDNGRIETGMSTDEVKIDEGKENGQSMISKLNEKLIECGLELVEEGGKFRLRGIASVLRQKETVYLDSKLFKVEGGKVWLRDPNSLQTVYVNRFERHFPLAIEGGVYHLAIEGGVYHQRLVTISTSRFDNPGTMSEQIVLDKVVENGKESFKITKAKDGGGSVESVNGAQESAISQKDFDRMAKGLKKIENISGLSEEELKKHEKALETFKDENGKTFVSITNLDAKKNLKEGTDFSKEELFDWFDKYTEKNNLNKFSAVDKEKLMIRLSEWRFTLLKGKFKNIEAHNKAYRERLDWCKRYVIIPNFKARMEELKAKGVIFQYTAEQLADEMTKRLEAISILRDKPDVLPDGSSVAIAIGRGGNGLHLLLNGKFEGEYGVILDKSMNLGDAVRTGKPNLMKELGLVIRESLAGKPKIDVGELVYDNIKYNYLKIDKFMQSPFARKLASLKNLAFILGKEKYNKLASYYEQAREGAAKVNWAQVLDAVKEFISMAQKIEEEHDKNMMATSWKGVDGKEYFVLYQQVIYSGVFNKCANTTGVFVDQLAIASRDDLVRQGVVAGDSNFVQVLNSNAAYQVTVFNLGVGVSGMVTPEPDVGGGLPPKTPGKDNTPTETNEKNM